jgi:magnesium transporter
MLSHSNRILLDTIKRLMRRGASGHLKNIINKAHPADLAKVFLSFPLNHQKYLFDFIADREIQGQLLSKLDKDNLREFTEHIPIEELIPIFEKLPSDDVADLVGDLPEEKANAILEGMKKEDSQEVGDLLQYDENTAGGIMTPDFIALKEGSTAQEAIHALQKEYLDVEMPFYLYVVDSEDRLVGVSSLRQLVMVAPETTLNQFMSKDVFGVYTNTDQEEVAKIVARYDLLAVPVMDADRKMVGIVTVDDVIDIIRDEATEDMLKMAGVGEDFVETKSVLTSSRIRLPWLFASCLGGVLAFFIIGHFEEMLNQVVYLAAFIPVVMGMGGNVGTQSSTIVVRGLATERIQAQNIGSVVLKEVAVGGILGAFYGLLLGAVAMSSYKMWRLSIVVGGSVILSMLVAALVGSLIPMLCYRIKIDPAVATGPFVTTAMDIISVFSYFIFAKYLLGI